jgi:SAM-dependent methyltransferase
VNEGHMEFCTSPDWQRILEDLILPGALERVDLGARVIEVGPGPGFTTDVLCRSSDHVTAVEIDPKLADQLRERTDDARVHVLVGDARSTGLPSGSFTGAASFHMLHHIASDQDQDAVFRELQRLLEPGGRIVLADGFDSEEVRTFHEGDTYNPIDPALLPRRLADSGFSSIDIVTHDWGWYCWAESSD